MGGEGVEHNGQRGKTVTPMAIALWVSFYKETPERAEIFIQLLTASSLAGDQQQLQG